MKGRDTFTLKEIEILFSLITKLRNELYEDKQKSIRNRMRKIGFYISDFALNGITVDDFNGLIANGSIKIKDVQEFQSRNVVNAKLQKDDETSDTSDFKKGLAPWADENSRVLILGTLPGDESLKKQAYYKNKSRNSFWKIMHELYPEDMDMADKDFVIKHNIALWDCLHSAEREGSTDDGFKGNEQPNDLATFLKDHPSIHTIFLNGKTMTKISFDEYFKRIREQYDVVVLESSANTNAKPLEVKVENWQQVKNILENN